MTALDAKGLPDSLTSTLTEKFYLDGTATTASLVYSKTFVFNTKLKGVMIRVLYTRVTGSLLVEFFKNDIAIPGSSVTINGTYPVSASISPLNVAMIPGDILTAKATTTSFTPLKNVCQLDVSMQ